MNLTRALRNSSGVVVAFTLLLSGCSSDSSDSGSSDSGSSDSGSSGSGSSGSGEQSQQSSSKESQPAADFDQTAAKDALLVESDLPPGYSAFPDDQLAQGAEQAGGMGGALDGVSIEPKSCEVVMKAVLGGADLASVAEQAAVRVFSSSSAGIVSQIIAPTDLLTGYTVPESFANECSNITMTMPDGSTSEASTTKVDVQSYGEATNAFITDLTMNFNGQSINLQSGSAYVEGTSAGMALGVTGDSEGGDLEAQLSELLDKAYAKAEPVLG
ncbi:hypothetical protein EK0264_18670 [Epidermidibacterium keratini]|uniref:DUF5642 domain-containing protein n=1 Tax=Epidermidibacterium keratini TaxID=1891644 RepID=A0A7L4YT50_9ACTN|nr:hypothetical protein [Epidermidibacterium keratini]QHC02094.1 hypothetical protein EK0264_18670 [Epidermidibacterium keratini]